MDYARWQHVLYLGKTWQVVKVYRLHRKLKRYDTEYEPVVSCEDLDKENAKEGVK